MAMMEVDSSCLWTFGRLDHDTVLYVTCFLPNSSILALSAASHEWARIFRVAVVRLSLSKLSLRGAPLSPALEAVCRLSALDLIRGVTCRRRGRPRSTISEIPSLRFGWRWGGGGLPATAPGVETRSRDGTEPVGEGGRP